MVHPIKICKQKGKCDNLILIYGKMRSEVHFLKSSATSIKIFSFDTYFTKEENTIKLRIALKDYLKFLPLLS